MKRRNYLAAAGIALTAPLVGCLRSESAPRARTTVPNTETTEPADGTRTEPRETDGGSILGRLHNEAAEPRPFTVVITDSDGSVRSEIDRTVGPTDTVSLPPLGRPGTDRTFEVTVGDATVSKTFSFDVEPTPERIDGIVDIRYTSAGDVTVEFTPIEYPHDDVVAADPRVDTPPQEITLPDEPDDPSGDEWNDEYLGERMATEPSLEFTTVTRRRGVLPAFERSDREGDFYVVTLLTDEAIRDTLLDLDAVDESTRQRLSAVDFDESMLVAVESGYGSGSVAHRWARVEETERGVHLHGYYTDPYVQTSDLASRVSLLEVERPTADPTLARVSLTVSEDRRVHFNSTEGVVTVAPS